MQVCVRGEQIAQIIAVRNHRKGKESENCGLLVRSLATDGCRYHGVGSGLSLGVIDQRAVQVANAEAEAE